MKNIILIISFSFCIIQIIKAQVITCVPCDQIGMVMNVGSQQTSISIYHSGQYMTHPRSENIFMWEFTDQQGNILHQDTLVDASTISFGHSWSLNDTMNVSVHFVNDSANLNNWYVSQGLPPNGNSINCLFEDQIYWSTGPGNPWGSWTFIHNNAGVDLTDLNQITILEPDFKIFPNPSSNQLNIDGPKEGYSIKIMDVNGNLIKSVGEVNGEINLNISFLIPGIYLLNVNSNNGEESHKFIKK